MILRRLIFVLPLIVAACGGTSGATEPAGPSCVPGDLSCGLLQAEDIAYLFGDTATFTAEEQNTTLEGADWCGVKTPSPTVNHSLVLTGTLEGENSQLSIVSNVLEFPPGQAEEFLDVIGSLDQGCDWIEGGVLFQFLDVVDPRLFAEESTGALFRVSPGSTAQNIQIFWLRQGDLVQSIAFAPSISANDLIDAILDVANQKLQAINP